MNKKSFERTKIAASQFMQSIFEKLFKKLARDVFQ